MNIIKNNPWIDNENLPEFIRGASEDDILVGLAGLGNLRRNARETALDIHRNGYVFESDILQDLVSGKLFIMDARKKSREWVRSVCNE